MSTENLTPNTLATITQDGTLATSKADILLQAEAVIPGGVNSSLRNIEPRLVPLKAEGAYFWDADGTRYLDYHGAFGPPILGHSYPSVTRAVQEAVQRTDQVGVGVGPHEVELSLLIAKHIPSAERVLLCNSGSEATYHAIRLSRAVTGRTKIIKFQGCYHGFHDAVAMNCISPEAKLGQRDPFSKGSHPQVLGDTIVCEFNNLDSVETAFKTFEGQIAAIIVEPIPHNVGCLLPEDGFHAGLRKLTTQYGAILIFDEVITGFRHALGGYQSICGVTPDLTTLGKAIANGYPIAALAGKKEFMNRFNTRSGGDVFFAGTFNGHPVGSSAAIATIKALESENAHEYLFALGDTMRSGLREIMNRRGVTAEVAGFGSVFVTYFLEGPVRRYTDLLKNDADFFIDYRRRLLAKGIYKLPMNLKRNHLSLSHTHEDVQLTLEACDAVIGEMVKA